MSAIFSDCGKHRMRLEREIDDDGIVVASFGVNPSVAGATHNDQTIRKDIGFGQRLGWRRIIKGNLFTHVATDVRELAAVEWPNSPDADWHAAQIMRDADQVIFTWGPTAKLPKRLRARWRVIWELARSLDIEPLCFGTAKDGHPLHTLMLPYSSTLRPWSPPL